MSLEHCFTAFLKAEIETWRGSDSGGRILSNLGILVVKKRLVIFSFENGIVYLGLLRVLREEVDFVKDNSSCGGPCLIILYAILPASK